MVKQDECIPCGRVAPMFVALANKYDTVAQFGTHTIDANDFAFAHDVLGVSCTPTFLIYKNGEVVYRLSSAKRFAELKRRVEILYPTI